MSNLLPKIVGFAAVPAAAVLVERVASPAVGAHLAEKAHPVSLVAGVGTAVSLAAAYGAYHVSNRAFSPGAYGFARGGMWGALLGAAAFATLGLTREKTPMNVPPANTSGVKGELQKLSDKTYDLLMAKSVAAVTSARMKKLAAKNG